MSLSSSTFSNADRECASRWAARLADGSLSASHRADLEAWLEAYPARRGLLAEYLAVSDLLDEALPGAEPGGALAFPAPAARRRVLRAFFAGSALAAAAALALGIWLTQGTGADEPRRFESPAGARREVLLADGSRIELNATGRLSVAYGQEGRRVLLEKGEAYFEVTPDASRPFTVDTPSGSARVLGTAFSVGVGEDGHLRVVVREGRVEVRPSGNPAGSVELGAGRALEASAGALYLTDLSGEALADALAWRRGERVFQGTPLAEAAGLMARLNGRQVDVDPSVAGLRLGGRFSQDDFDAFLRAVTEVLPVTVSRDGSGRPTLLPAGGPDRP